MTPEQLKKRRAILRKFKTIKLPVYVYPDAVGDETMDLLNEMIDDGWIEGHPLRNHTGVGWTTIQVVRIKQLGHDALYQPKFSIRRLLSNQTFWTAIGALAATVAMVAAMLALRASKPVQENKPEPAIVSTPIPIESPLQTTPSATPTEAPGGGL